MHHLYLLLLRITNLNPGKRFVYLTFDDGPGWNRTTNENSLEILDILHQYDIKATFFLVGHHVDLFPKTFRRILSEGHAIGSHSFDHPSFLTLTPGQIAEQLIKTEEAFLAALDGSRPLDFRYFRYPYGKGDDQTDEVVESRGYEIVWWDVNSFDWEFTEAGKSPVELADEILRNIEETDSSSKVIVFHSTYVITVNALPIILSRLKDKGYHFGRLP